MPVQKLGPGTHRVSGGRLETNNSSENAQQNNTANLTGSTVVRPQAHRLEIANHSQKWEALVKTLSENGRR